MPPQTDRYSSKINTVLLYYLSSGTLHLPISQVSELSLHAESKGDSQQHSGILMCTTVDQVPSNTRKAGHFRGFMQDLNLLVVSCCSMFCVELCIPFNTLHYNTQIIIPF